MLMERLFVCLNFYIRVLIINEQYVVNRWIGKWCVSTDSTANIF